MLLGPSLLLALPLISSRVMAAPSQSPVAPLTAAERKLLGESVATDRAALSATTPGRRAPSPNGPSNPASAVGVLPTGAAASPLAWAGVMNPNMSLILDGAVGWFNTDTPLQQGAHDPNQTGFTFQQLEMHLAAAVDPYLNMQTNIVFSQFGVEVEEAYARTRGLPGALQLRAGQFLTRFGRQNATHPHTWDFADQPMVFSKMFGGEGLRGVGAEVSWLSPLPWYAELVVSTQMATGACCSRSFWGAKALPVQTPLDLMQLARLQQFFPLNSDWSVTWGLSAATGPNGSGRGDWGSNRTDIYGTDVYVRYRPVASRVRTALSWQTELLLRRRQVPERLLRDWGLTSQLVWRYALRQAVGLRVEHATGVTADPLDVAWNGDRQRATAEWTFYPSHFSRLRVQGSVDRPSWLVSPVYAVFLALEVVVGAHGSHSF